MPTATDSRCSCPGCELGQAAPGLVGHSDKVEHLVRGSEVGLVEMPGRVLGERDVALRRQVRQEVVRCALQDDAHLDGAHLVQVAVADCGEVVVADAQATGARVLQPGQQPQQR